MRFIFLYDQNGFLYQIRRGSPDTLFYNVALDADSNLTILTPTKNLGYKIFQKNGMIDSVEHFYFGQQTLLYWYIKDPFSGNSLTSQDQITYRLYDLIKSDSGYQSSSMQYLLPGYLSYFTTTANYSFTNVLNSYNAPCQFPFDGIGDDNGYFIASYEADVVSPLYIASLNGFYVFGYPNKYLINTANGHPYQYTFNSNHQVIELRNNYLDQFKAWLTFEYY